MPVDIQYVRLEEDVCEAVSRMAREQLRTASDIVNEILRDHLRRPRPKLEEPAKQGNGTI